jgi:hypothetical protein
VHDLESQPSKRNRFAVTEAHVDKRRRAGVVHHHRHIETAGELTISGEMIRVRMCIDQIADAQAVLTGEREAAIDLAHFRIYQRGRARLSATYQIRPTPTGRDLFEYHDSTMLLNV